MYTQAEINAKITALKTYSAAQDPLTVDLFTPLETAVQSYFAASTNIAGDVYKRQPSRCAGHQINQHIAAYISTNR